MTDQLKESTLSKAQKMKFNRNEEYKRTSDPVLSQLYNSQSGPQFISLDQFIQSRSHELSHFTRILENKFSSRLQHQLLPKHMRRRAMAHNHYRIPMRIRIKALHELKSAEAQVLKRSKCRKHRRKLKYLLNLYEMRKRKNQWMETHIWHAKRFKVKDMWGQKVPYKCYDKLMKVSYRLATKKQNGSCLYDKSYFKTLFISCSSQQSFEQVEEMLFGRKSNLQFRFKEIASLKIRSNIMSCPSTELLISREQKIVYVIAHPLLAESIQKFIEQNLVNVEIRFGTMYLNNFNLISKQYALQNLYMVLKPLAHDQKSNEILENFEKCNFDSSSISALQVLPINISVEKLTPDFRLNERILSNQLNILIQNSGEGNQQIKDDDPFQIPNYIYKLKEQSIQQNQSPLELAKNNFYMKKQSQERIQILDNFDVNFAGKKLSPIRWVGTQRTSYTHRKGTRQRIQSLIAKYKTPFKSKKPNTKKDKLPKLQNVSEKEDEDMFEDEKDNLIPSSNTKDFFTIFVIKLGSCSQAFQTFQVLIPEGYGLNLFRRFSYSGCKVLGLKEFASLYFEAGVPFFPNDFPHIEQAAVGLKSEALQQLEIYLKKPPSKRVNYCIYKSNYPFYPGFAMRKEGNFVIVKIEPIFRGLPKQNGLICQLENDDWDFLKQSHESDLKILEMKGKDSNGRLKEINIEYASKFGKFICLSKMQKLEAKYKINDEPMELDFEFSNFGLESLKSKKQNSREIIGQVTTGGFSLSKNQGFGIGVILQSAWESNFQKQQIYFKLQQQKTFKNKIVLLVRNTSSFNYIPVAVSLINSH